MKISWVFKVKNDGRKKGRFVARKFTQDYGIDFTETFASVGKFTSFRSLFANAAHQRLRIRQYAEAYINGQLKQMIYMLLPDERPIVHL